MIYDPSPQDLRWYMRLYNLAGEVTTQTGIALATDFVAGDNKPWQYYAGVAAGSAAAATGIPGASAIMYVVGETLRVHLLKSPDGGEVDIFLDGVAVSTIQAYSANLLWEMVEIAVGSAAGTMRTVKFVNRALDGETSAWMAIAAPFVILADELIPRILSPARVTTQPWEIVFSILDNKRRVSQSRIYYPGSADLTEVETYAQVVATTLKEGLLDGRIQSINITRGAQLLPGLKAAPYPTADQQEKMKLTFDVGDSLKSVIQVPTWDETHAILDEPAKKRRIASNNTVNNLLRLLTEGLDAELRPVDFRGQPHQKLLKSEMRWIP